MEGIRWHQWLSTQVRGGSCHHVSLSYSIQAGGDYQCKLHKVYFADCDHGG